ERSGARRRVGRGRAPCSCDRHPTLAAIARSHRRCHMNDPPPTAVEGNWGSANGGLAGRLSRLIKRAAPWRWARGGSPAGLAHRWLRRATCWSAEPVGGVGQRRKRPVDSVKVRSAGVARPGVAAEPPRRNSYGWREAVRRPAERSLLGGLTVATTV